MLVFLSHENKWQFTLKGDSLSIHALKHPDIGPYDAEDKDAFLFEKTHHYNKVIEIIDTIFEIFIKYRISENWEKQIVPSIKKWIRP